MLKIDEKEAEVLLKWVQNLVNEIYENRYKIQPDYTMKKGLSPTDIIKLLPETNCKKCGLPSCPSFAFKLLKKEVKISECPPPFSNEYQDKRQVLIELLRSIQGRFVL